MARKKATPAVDPLSAVPESEREGVRAIHASEATQQTHDDQRQQKAEAVEKIEQLKRDLLGYGRGLPWALSQLPGLAERFGLSAEYQIWRTSSPW